MQGPAGSRGSEAGELAMGARSWVGGSFNLQRDSRGERIPRSGMNARIPDQSRQSGPSKIGLRGLGFCWIGDGATQAARIVNVGMSWPASWQASEVIGEISVVNSLSATARASASFQHEEQRSLG